MATDGDCGIPEAAYRNENVHTSPAAKLSPPDAVLIYIPPAFTGAVVHVAFLACGALNRGSAMSIVLTTPSVPAVNVHGVPTPEYARFQ
jgi:hypothetical protein